MDAIILAAGIGERLKPITTSRPKPFTPILGRPLIERTIDMLRNYASNIYVVIKEGRESDFANIKNITLVEQKEGGYGDGAGLNSVRTKNDFIMVYGDLLFDEDSIKRVAEAKGNALLCMPNPNPQNYGVVYAKNGLLERMEEKPPRPTSNMINIGIYKFTPDIFRYLEKMKNSSNTGELELVDAVTAMSKDIPIQVISYNGLWMDIGRPWHVLAANRIILKRECAKQTQSNVRRDGVLIRGKAIIKSGVTIGKGTEIVGPVFIGEGTKIGRNVHIKPFSVIGHDVIIEDGAYVGASLIMEGTSIGANSRIRDSIICENAYIGSNTDMINHRADGNQISMLLGGKVYNTGLKRFGCIMGARSAVGRGSRIMPGVKIGTDRRLLASSMALSHDVV